MLSPQKYFRNHLAELRADFEWIQANSTREDRDYQFFEGDTTSRVQVLLHALKAQPSFRDQVAENLPDYFKSALDWAERELATLDVDELQAACKACLKAPIEDNAHRQHRKKVLNQSSRFTPKVPLPDLKSKNAPLAGTAETMTIREFCVGRKIAGASLNRAIERLRKRLDSRGVKPVIPGCPAKKGQSATPRQYSIAELTNSFELDEPGAKVRK